MAPSLSALVPSTKHDTEKAAALVALGYPAVEPVLPEILAWMQDANWPVAQIFGPFLAGIGTPLSPFIRNILATDDDVWKYWIITGVVGASPPLAGALRSELERAANEPTAGEEIEDVSQAARDVLKALDGPC